MVAAPFSRLSPGCAGRSISPSGAARIRGSSLGSPTRHNACRRAFGLSGAPPTVSAPRLRLSAPGDMIGGSVPAGVLSASSFPQLIGSAGPLTSSPSRILTGGNGLLDNAGSVRLGMRRPDSMATSTDPHALLTELHNTNENLRMAFVQLVNNMGNSGFSVKANLAAMVREDVAMSNAVLEPFLPIGHGAASAPVASPVLQSQFLEADDVVLSSIGSAVASSYKDDNPAAVPFDMLSATAPPHYGASTPGVLAPVHAAWDGQPPMQRFRTGPSAGRRVASELGLASARGRENAENYAPPNQSILAGKAWLKPVLKAREATMGGSHSRQAGSVQVRQGSMSMYGKAMNGQSPLDMLSKTVSHPAAMSNLVRECRTPLVPTSWPRATSPDTRRCTFGTLQQQPLKAKAISTSTALPPPRLAASQPPRSNCIPTRLAATATPAAAPPQHIWAYSTGAAVYRGCDAGRRSVGYARIAA